MPDAAVLLALAAAARDRTRVRLAYRSWRGEDSERDLDAYGLVFHSGRWYASGFDHRRGAVRTFRGDRIASGPPPPGPFAGPGGFGVGVALMMASARVRSARVLILMLFVAPSTK